jgi:hypothetical protein
MRRVCTFFCVLLDAGELCGNLTLNMLTWRIWWAPKNISKWQMGFNSAINPYLANVENRVISNIAESWQMGFNLAFKGLILASLFYRRACCYHIFLKPPTHALYFKIHFKTQALLWNIKMSVSAVLPYMFRSLTLNIFRAMVPVAMLLSALLFLSQLYLGMWLYFLLVLLSCVPSRCSRSGRVHFCEKCPKRSTRIF